MLPAEFKRFQSEFAQSKDTVWILKPCGSSQGKGIQILTKPQQVKKLENQYKSSKYSNSYNKKQHIFVVSEYINSPLLIQGRKFDLRLYVLVTSYKPLKIWRFEDGFCKICSTKYDKIEKDSDPSQRLFAHLTNIHYQKQSENYNNQHGGKWPLKSFKLFCEMNYGKQKT